MRARFYCNNKECKKAFYFKVPDEIMVDEVNMAVLYCPFCAGELTQSRLSPNLNKYNISEDQVTNNNI